MGLEVEVVGETNKFDIIVIGGGIAGMTASSVATQAGLKSCFLERDVPGGKLMHIGPVNNFADQPIDGTVLGQQMFKQATEEIKTNYVFGNVQTIKPKNGMFYLFTEDGQTWEAKAIIIATGTVINKLNVDNEESYAGKGISYCVECDAPLTRDKIVAVIGHGNDTQEINRFAKDVNIYQPEDVKGFEGDGTKLTGIITKDGTHPCDFAFIDVGFKPNVDFLPSEIQVDDKKQIIVDGKMASPYIEGVFACGDCINTDLKMIKPAMSQATIAANAAVEYVKSKKW